MKANANIDINFETKLKLNITFRLATDAARVCVQNLLIQWLCNSEYYISRNHNILNVWWFTLRRWVACSIAHICVIESNQPSKIFRHRQRNVTHTERLCRHTKRHIFANTSQDGSSATPILIAIFLVKLNHLYTRKTNGKGKFIVRNKAHHKFLSHAPTWCRAYWKDSKHGHGWHSLSLPSPLMMVILLLLVRVRTDKRNKTNYSLHVLVWLFQRAAQSWFAAFVLLYAELFILHHFRIEY